MVEREFVPGRPRPAFYWLRSADLPGFAIACILQEALGKVPALGIGLGADLSLERAMYKSLLEAVGVIQLAKITLLNRAATQEYREEVDPTRIFDLDSNVAYYAEPGRQSQLLQKFASDDDYPAGDLQPDGTLQPDQEVRLLLEGFSSVNINLVGLDLTTNDIRDLGFSVHRVWSPGLLSLALPSAPPLLHARFGAYGGAENNGPHPYP
jgi:ribosomal protein S12 methylthiotransferase accessory factor YcaO